jgi:FAD/FMN-containing dehydrogenase
MKTGVSVASIELMEGRVAAAVGAANTSLHGARLVVRPGSAAEIADILRVAGEVALPLGVGVAAGIDLDLSRMTNVLHLDETSLLVSAQAGLTWSALEQQLGERGLTLGVLPEASRSRTLGALVAAPRPSEASPRAGRFVQQVAGISGLLADGTEISTRIAPRKATGPDLLHGIVGGRGTLGLVTSVTQRIFRRGEVREEAAFGFAAVEDALRAARALLVAGGRPLDLFIAPEPPVLSLAVDGAPQHTAAERELAERIASAHGGKPVPFHPPPSFGRTVATAYERFVPLERIEAAIPSRDGRVLGFSVLGATVVDPSRAPERPAAHALTLALKHRLDPDRRFPDWPGT